MESTVRNKLERWMRHQILVADDEKGRCKKLIVRHVSGGKASSELGSIPVPKKMEDEQWFNEACSAIENMVYDDAEGLGGVQTYVVFAYFELRSDKPGGRFTIRETSSGDVDPEDIESEPPTKTGVLTQMMRHTEAATRMSLMSASQVMNTMRSTIARQADQIEKLIVERHAGFEIMERLKSQDLERRMLVEHEEKDTKFKQDVLDKITPLVPVLINRLTGRKMLPEKKTAIEGMAQGLIESMTPEQMDKLQSVFTPAQMVSLLEIFQVVQPPEKPGGNGAAKTQQ